jgi:hypothetical protein
MEFSMTPFLLVAVLGFVGWATQCLYRQSQISTGSRGSVFLLLAVLLLWGVLIALLGISGISTSEEFLALWPGYWFPFVPVFLALAGVLGSTNLRSALRALVDHRATSSLITIHALRILAIGGIIKAMNGEFPTLFAYLVGGPDLLFGLSALLMSRLVARDALGRKALLIWNLAGAGVILLPMLLLMPIFMGDPLFSRLFAFPMLLAPGLIVPVFVMLNLLVVWRLWEVPR